MVIKVLHQPTNTAVEIQYICSFFGATACFGCFHQPSSDHKQNKKWRDLA